MRSSKLLVFFVIIAAFAAGVYFRDDAIKFYENFSSNIEDFKKADIDAIAEEISKKISLPAPLNAGGEQNQITLLQSKIIFETNLQRSENGLPALKENQILDKAAAAKANDMFLNQYFEHVSPSGIDPGKLVQNYGYDYIVTGENLILGNFSSEKEVVQDWMDSPGHRANILNDRYIEIGVAIIKGSYNGQTVWIGVQEFGLPMASCQTPDQNFKDQIDFQKNQLDILLGQIDEKKKQIEESGKKSPAYSQMVKDYNQLVDEYNSLAKELKILVVEYNNQVNSFNSCVAGS